MYVSRIAAIRSTCSLLGDCAPMSFMLGEMTEYGRSGAFSSSRSVVGICAGAENRGWLLSVRRQSTSILCRSCKNNQPKSSSGSWTVQRTSSTFVLSNTSGTPHHSSVTSWYFFLWTIVSKGLCHKSNEETFSLATLPPSARSWHPIQAPQAQKATSSAAASPLDSRPCGIPPASSPPY